MGNKLIASLFEAQSKIVADSSRSKAMANRWLVWAIDASGRAGDRQLALQSVSTWLTMRPPMEDA
jgi:hypothetical protein